MSYYVESRWKIEAEKRRQAYLDRISENTKNFRNRYREKFDSLINQGLEEYIPKEFANFRDQLNLLDRLILSDPERARDLSFKVGQLLSRLSSLARAARKEFEVRERQRRKDMEEKRRQATTDLNKYIQEQIYEISDPIELDYAYDDIRIIQAEYQGLSIDVGELGSIKSSIALKFKELRKAAKIKAEIWKNEQEKANETEAAEELLSFYSDQANSDSAKNPKAFDAMLSSLDEVKKLIENKTNPQEIIKKIEDAAMQADTSIADENCRRAVVRSIMDSLTQSGFVVSKPKLSSSDIDEVIILARKPAGAEATFKVTADGGMKYKFHHYEGMECKNDIDKVLPLLKDIYGVDLSDERVLWQNPERISRSSRPLEGDIGEQKNGK